MTELPSIGDLISFEFIDVTTHQRLWAVGKVVKVGLAMCAVTQWIPVKWKVEHSPSVLEEISFVSDYVCSEQNSLSSKEYSTKNAKVNLDYLKNIERAKRRISLLEALNQSLLDDKANDIKDLCFELSAHVRELCFSNILDRMHVVKNAQYAFVLEEEVERYNFPLSMNCGYKTDCTSYAKVKELKFFDSRWSWSPLLPTFVSSHFVNFPWNDFEEILRYKPEETRNIFIAEVAFCCQVPIHCIIDTYFGCTKDNFSASFKVVHHPSIDASELDVRISQHPFWSLLHLRDSSTSERKGLDRAAIYFRRMLGLDEDAGSGMYFLQFLEALPQMNFVTDKGAYESELMEMLSLCERLNNENLKIQALLKIKEKESLEKSSVDRIEKSLKVMEDQNGSREILVNQNASGKEDCQNVGDNSTQVLSEVESDSKIVALKSEGCEIVSFDKSEMSSLQEHVKRTEAENSDLLKKIEELLSMLSEALTVQQQDLTSRMRAEIELLRIQGITDASTYFLSTLGKEKVV